MSIERVPGPIRSKRGLGVGARLDLSIDYYRAPDGLGEDFGSLHGRDEEGPWELHFANREEFERHVFGVADALHQVATRAREGRHGEHGRGPAVWLKAIGSTDRPAAETWWDEPSSEFGINFPYRPRSIEPGDLMVIYATGTGKIVGAVRVTSAWYHDGREERWPWRMHTEILVARPISQGESLDLISADRIIGKSIRQKSHIRLTEQEAMRALTALDASAPNPAFKH